MQAAEWRLDVDEWDGPERRKWSITRDMVFASPNGRFACVLYSCHEMRLECEVGLLAILEGPPDRPTVLLRPRAFTCLDLSPRPSAQWLALGQIVVVVPSFNSAYFNEKSLVSYTFVDVANRRFANHSAGGFEYLGQEFVEIGGGWITRLPPEQGKRDVVRVSRQDLDWKPWKELRRWPWK